MFNFNFSDINIDLEFLKRIRKRDILATVVIILFLSAFFRREIEQYLFSRKDFVTDRLIQKQLVNNKLEEIRERNNCSYVAVNLFHNGVVATNGTHFAKMTREYEAKAYNKLPLSYKLQGYDITPFSALLLKLRIDGYIYIPNVDFFGDEYTRNTLKYFGCKSIFYVAIIENKKYIGFMTFEYEKATNLSESNLESLRKEVYLIEPLIKSK
jgi:hypothetical protein